VIRLATVADCGAAARLISVCVPDAMVTEASLAHGFTSTPAKAMTRWWAAFDGEELVGWAFAALAYWSDDGRGGLAVVVHPDARGRGIGSELYDAAVDHVTGAGARVITASSANDAASRGFVERRGFTHVDTRRVSGVDPRTISDAPTPPSGLEIAAWRAFADDPRPIWHVLAQASADIPSVVSNDRSAMSFDEWRDETWEDPDIDLDVSLVVLASGEVVAATFVVTDPPSARMLSGMTGTLPDYRGRGLARLVKHHSLRRAAQRGIKLALTENHAGNVPMLAVNDRLGYEPLEPRLEWKKLTSRRTEPR
jgi:GNAT superfamily N-acetyltransferase